MVKRFHAALLVVTMMLMTVFLCFGYAALTDMLGISGSASISGPQYDVYISDISPNTSAGVTVKNYFATTMSASVSVSGTSTFTVTVVNDSDKVYIYERLIEGKETDIEGIYKGTDIVCSITGLSFLQELGPGERVSFTLTLRNAKGISVDNFYLKFNFVEKTGSEILPGDHICESKCPDCGKCLDMSCTEDVCKDKCQGHVHECESICPQCGLCMDMFCTEAACANKCQGHAHICESVCSECGKCFDLQCTEDACADKCEGHPDHVCTSKCDICGKCIDENCTVCTDKCLGHHVCESVCSECGKCYDIACMEDVCADKCEGHPDHVCTSKCAMCGGCIDGNCTVCTDKCTCTNEGLSSNFLGLLQALLSEQDRCLNDRGSKDVIYDAVLQYSTLHCLTNSVQGGNMTNITENANQKLTEEIHFVMTEVEGNANQIYLYMYYGDEAISANSGKNILTYFQVITYDAPSDTWFADGTYIGKAHVAYIGGGGNANKKVWTVDPTTWTFGEPQS